MIEKKDYFLENFIQVEHFLENELQEQLKLLNSANPKSISFAQKQIFTLSEYQCMPYTLISTESGWKKLFNYLSFCEMQAQEADVLDKFEIFPYSPNPSDFIQMLNKRLEEKKTFDLQIEKFNNMKDFFSRINIKNTVNVNQEQKKHVRKLIQEMVTNVDNIIHCYKAINQASVFAYQDIKRQNIKCIHSLMNNAESKYKKIQKIIRNQYAFNQNKENIKNSTVRLNFFNDSHENNQRPFIQKESQKKEDLNFKQNLTSCEGYDKKWW